jgi:hypothetical protein
MKPAKVSTELALLVPPACEICGEATRLVGLEAAADGDEFADLCTYVCGSCGKLQTRIFVRTGGVKLIDVLKQADGADRSGTDGSGPVGLAADKSAVTD